ncbi:SRPBCC family protein [Nocardia transvalensis]|uniref:SRPBCC family protein n=1 Tax=Nocardia transvalensis TaxID=37333 RepID=UPI0018943C0F|nr:SRPBCC family protein [Nocardia transvalensis]MBF6329233.1 SRPBCC family protein [Nocardia transvalensis]
MGVVNVHSRRLPATEAEVGALIDTLASEHDKLWPVGRWPTMRFDGPLKVGAVGGHGPVRYTVDQYEPGRWVRFRFTGPRGFDGFHEYTIHPDGNGTVVLRHLLAIHARGPARLTWPLLWRWLHDACVEDSLDRAEQAVTGAVARPARWNAVVRMLRAVNERARLR